MLGIERSATEQQVKEAYFRLAKRFHPDAHHDATLSDLRDQLEAVFIRLGEAYETFEEPPRARRVRGAAGARPHACRGQRAPRVRRRSPSRPATWRPSAEAEDARAQGGLEHFEKGQTFDAIQLLEPAIERLAASTTKSPASCSSAPGCCWRRRT